MFKWKEELHISHFKQKLEMIKLSEEDTSKAKTGRKLGLSHQTLSQVVNAKETKSDAPVNT